VHSKKVSRAEAVEAIEHMAGFTAAVREDLVKEGKLSFMVQVAMKQTEDMIEVLRKVSGGQGVMVVADKLGGGSTPLRDDNVPNSVRGMGGDRHGVGVR
jgi:hypothetical protein